MNLFTLYEKKPRLVFDILNIHLFKTYGYHSKFMTHTPDSLKISKECFISIECLKEVKSVQRKFSKTELIFKKDFLGYPMKLEFPIFITSLMQQCQESTDLEDMFKKIGNSPDDIVKGIGEQLKDEKINVIAEIFELIKRTELNTTRLWNAQELSDSSLNDTLLVLNYKIWETVFQDEVFEKLFINDLAEIKQIERKSRTTNNYKGMMNWIIDLVTEKFE